MFPSPKPSVMKSSPVLLGVGTLLVAMVAAVAIREIGGEEEGGSDGGRAVPVRLGEVGSHRFADVVEAVGTVRAAESVAITANVADTVTSIDFDSGDAVSTGAVLLTLADAEERAAVADAEAALAEAEREAGRLEDLADSNAVARSELTRSRAALTRAEAQRDAARARLDDHVIRAPFDGRIGLRDVSLGAYVSPGDLLLTLDQIDNVDLDFTVPERFLAGLDRGLAVRARATAYPDEAFEGTIAGIDSRVDPVTRAVTVRARLPNPDARLRPGMLLSVEIRRDERESPAIPEVAVMRDGERTSVFGIERTDEGERAVSRRITLGARDGRLIEVLDGLSPGDTFVSEGMHRASDGGAVEIKGRDSDEDGSNGRDAGEGGTGEGSASAAAETSDS